MKNKQSFTDLIQDAHEMLTDQPKEVQELIYWAITLDDEARAALKFAYHNLHAER